MDVRALLLSTVAIAATGCTSVWNCKPDSETFSYTDQPVTAADIQSALSYWGAESSDDLECRAVCDAVYRADKGWESSVDEGSCALSLDEAVTASDDTAAASDDVVGSISCEGSGFEYFCEGRRPLGHQEIRTASGSLGDYLACCAHLEAASVDAFDQLAAQLRRWGAPEDLVARCLRAAREESAHADTVARLAAQHGGRPAAPRREPAPEDRLSVAIHNAVEGCVFETWAAAVALLKAERADDADIRAAYAQIAAEEASHGQLAWDLHAWLLGQLTDAERATVHAAQRAALDRLPRIAAAQARAMPGELRMPTAEQVSAMAEHFSQQLAA